MFKWIQSHKTTVLLALGYLTAGVILLTVFLYLTFPWQKLSDFILVKAEEAMVSEIEVKESEIRFPLKLIWTGVVVSPHKAPHTDGRPMRVVADRITLEWPLGPLLSRRMELLWSVETAGGEGRGLMAVQPTDQGLQYHFRGDAKQLRLGQIIEFMTPNTYGIEGTVKIADARFDFLEADVLRGSGSAVLEVSDARISSLDLAFSRITGQLSMKAGVANLENVMAQGPAIELVGGGNILLRSGLPESLINFNSRASVKKATGPLSILGGSSAEGGPESGIDLALRGTFKRPTLFFNGVPVFTFPST